MCVCVCGREVCVEYLFGMTRAVAGSTMHPAVRVLCFPVTVPLDLALLPFEFVGGFFQ